MGSGLSLLNRRTFVYIDAANLFYGGEKSLGWRIDYQKLLLYLQRKYQTSSVYYFGGVEIHGFPYDYLISESVSIYELEKYLSKLLEGTTIRTNTEERERLERHHKRARFYKKLDAFGYSLVLKPVKIYTDGDGKESRKANCDVDMALQLLTQMDLFDRVIVLSGDGDFLPVLKYLRNNNKEVLVLSRGPRTAKEIKQFAGNMFLDFEYLREILKEIN
ncbi:MAG TPA: NYN domain-containing protein [Candidatus Paceibacterota bacterium]|nr:NYN domain-containing protein [Candidatus Paceibacterota bacterium]